MNGVQVRSRTGICYPFWLYDGMVGYCGKCGFLTSWHFCDNCGRSNYPVL